MAGVVVSGAQVSYISQDCEEIPEFLGRKYGHMAKRLDLSFNLLRRWSHTLVRCTAKEQEAVVTGCSKGISNHDGEG